MNLKRIAGWSVLIVVVLAGLLFAADYLILHIKIAHGSGYASVTVRQYYAINEKNSRTEYVYGSSQEQPCVNSLLGHQGLLPCWYLRRHPDQQVEI